MIVDQKSLRKFKKTTNFFATPQKLADKMADLLDGTICRDCRILEPSAGMGSLIIATENRFKFPYRFEFCEMEESLCRQLNEYEHVGADFLQYNPGAAYEAVIMNPPFRNGADKRHVDHAWKCLKPGGSIVALVSQTAAQWIDDEFFGFVFHREEIKKGFSETSITTYLFLICKPLYEI